MKFEEQEIIQKHCLSKKRVREAILAIMTDWNPEDITCTCQSCSNVKYELIERDKLLKELGLEE